MTGTALFFVFVGVGVASAGLMKFVEWLDAPRSTRRVSRAVSVREDTDLRCAELELESARLAA